MRKNNVTLIILLLLGLFIGSILGQLLAPIEYLSFLTKSAQISWEPKADFEVIRYDISIHIKLNAISILGVIGSFWLYRKL
jgi:hypothetical protein